MHGALTNTYQWHCVECVNKLSLPVALCGMSSLLWRMDIHTYMYMYMLTFHGNNYRNITGVDLLSPYIANTILKETSIK